MGTRLLRGRAIESARHGRRARASLVVGASMAAPVAGTGSDWPVRSGSSADTMPCTYVVGVAEDIHAQSVAAERRPFYYYLPAAQWHPQDGGPVRARAG